MRASALTIVAIFAIVSGARGADKPAPPKLPLSQWWSIDLGAPASAGPVSDASRIYVALKTAELVAFDPGDGQEVWRIKKDVVTPMAASGDLLYVASGDAIEAIHTADHADAWTRPGLKTTVALVAHQGLLFVVTDAELVALRLDSGEIAWRYAAGGVKLPPATDGDRVYLGAADGLLVALNAKDGVQVWKTFVADGITALAAYDKRVYVGGGDKTLHCYTEKGIDKWQPFHLGGQAIGRIAVDDKRLYVASRDNIVRALDRSSGNQQWLGLLRARPTGGTFVSGHIVFVPIAGTDLVMLYDHDGGASGSLNLLGNAVPDLLPDVHDTVDGPIVYAVTGSLANEWSLTKFAPAAETVLLPFAMMTVPGLPYLTDPQLMSIGVVLGTLIRDDPPLQPVWQLGWPVIRTDPPLVPLTILPGVQLRPLSPVLPARRGGSGPGG